jgi:hypothetical protein
MNGWSGCGPADPARPHELVVLHLATSRLAWTARRTLRALQEHGALLDQALDAIALDHVAQ